MRFAAVSWQVYGAGAGTVRVLSFLIVGTPSHVVLAHQVPNSEPLWAAWFQTRSIPVALAAPFLLHLSHTISPYGGSTKVVHTLLLLGCSWVGQPKPQPVEHGVKRGVNNVEHTMLCCCAVVHTSTGQHSCTMTRFLCTPA